MERSHYRDQISEKFENHPIVAILGPRQCGKTTLSKQYARLFQEKDLHFFDLEDPMDLAQLENAKLTLEELTGLIVIDEIQRKPELFPILRVLADQNKNQKFLILGSASRDLIRQGSESLAGRVAYLELTPFNKEEIEDLKSLWVRGGFPKSFLANSEEKSYLWRKEYVRTFLEQDIPNLGFNIPAQAIRRFWMMLTHYHGQTLNYSELGKSLGLSDTTIRNYVDILAGTFMVRVLQPWHESIEKRQIKTPKIFFRDSGLFHYLSGIYSYQSLYTHPKLGASWEGFALEEVIRLLDIDAEDCYFWGIHSQAELDLLVVKNNRKIGFEIKFTEQPKITRSMKLALTTLNLDKLIVVCPGTKRFKLEAFIEVIGLKTISKKDNLTLSL